MFELCPFIFSRGQWPMTLPDLGFGNHFSNLPLPLRNILAKAFFLMKMGDEVTLYRKAPGSMEKLKKQFRA